MSSHATSCLQGEIVCLHGYRHYSLVVEESGISEWLGTSVHNLPRRYHDNWAFFGQNKWRHAYFNNFCLDLTHLGEGSPSLRLVVWYDQLSPAFKYLMCACVWTYICIFVVWRYVVLIVISYSAAQMSVTVRRCAKEQKSVTMVLAELASKKEPLLLPIQPPMSQDPLGVDIIFCPVWIKGKSHHLTPQITRTCSHEETTKRRFVTCGIERNSRFHFLLVFIWFEWSGRWMLVVLGGFHTQRSKRAGLRSRRKVLGGRQHPPPHPVKLSHYLSAISRWLRSYRIHLDAVSFILSFHQKKLQVRWIKPWH